MERIFLVVGAVLGFAGVALGAFGAHGLEGRLSPGDLDIFETGVRYQLVHSLALLVVALLAGRGGAEGALQVAGWAFVVGTLVFSGSLYVLVLSGVRWLGAVTPVGGVAFLVGWLALAWAGVKGS